MTVEVKPMTRTDPVAVDQMKERINAAGRTLTKLEDARHTASPWQATAMDRVMPLLKEIAANTETVIQYINKNQISARSNGCKEQEWR